MYFAYSDDGGRTWSTPKEISGSNPLCTFQSTGPTGECDEDSFPITEVAPNGDLVVHFQSGNMQTAWETPDEYEQHAAGGQVHQRWCDVQRAVVIANLEDGAADTPWSVIGRQTVTGHQIRWQSPGNITADPTNPAHWVVVYNDNFAGTHDAGPASCLDDDARNGTGLQPVQRRDGHQHLHGRELERRRDLDAANRAGRVSR